MWIFWQPRLLKLKLFFLDMQRQQSLGWGVGGPMALMGNFMEKRKGSGSFIRNKLK
jgi:hypothetical protein